MMQLLDPHQVPASPPPSHPHSGSIGSHMHDPIFRGKGVHFDHFHATYQTLTKPTGMMQLLDPHQVPVPPPPSNPPSTPFMRCMLPTKPAKPTCMMQPLGPHQVPVPPPLPPSLPFRRRMLPTKPCKTYGYDAAP